MAGTARLALLALCLGLAAGAQDAKPEDFDLVKFSGLWYELAFACNVSANSLPYAPEKMAAVVAKLEGGKTLLTVTYYRKDRCVVEQETALQGDAPGKFKILKAAGTKEVEILDTDYKTYTIMDISFLAGQLVWRVVKLYGRSLDGMEDALRKFREVARQQGFSNVTLLQHDLTCVKVLQLGGAPSS